MDVTDFYCGYEGEPEIWFAFTVGDVVKRFSLWEGYFDAIMAQIPYSPGGWPRIAHEYPLNTGWNETNDWPIPDLTGTIALFETPELTGEPLQVIRQKLIAHLHEASVAGVTVTMSRD